MKILQQNSESTPNPHICGSCGSSEIIKTKVSEENVWLCKCGERWLAHTQEWDRMPKFIRGKRVYKRDKKQKPRP